MTDAQGGKLPSQQFLLRPAEHLRRSLVPLCHEADLVQFDDGRRRLLDDRPQLGRCVLEILAGLLQLGGLFLHMAITLALCVAQRFVRLRASLMFFADVFGGVIGTGPC